jgi:DNA polymerase III delta prime subunit
MIVWYNGFVNKSTLIVSQNLAELRAYAENVAKGFNPADVFWLTEGAAAHIQVKETLEFLQMAHLAPLGDSKLMVICDASKLTIAAQNKILKIVEDAPAQTRFLLLATNPEPILNTVKSRCVHVYLPQSTDGPLVPQEIVEAARQLFNIEIDEKAYSPAQKCAILECRARMRRNLVFNCGAAAQNDMLLMEIYKNAKNS